MIRLFDEWIQESYITLSSTSPDDNPHFLYFSINNNIFIKLFHVGFPVYYEKEDYVLVTNWKDLIWKINKETKAIQKFISDFYICNIFFYKNLIIIFDELSILILNENLNLLRREVMNGIIIKCQIIDGRVESFDEHWKSLKILLSDF